jgi:UPF0042 nucleotide-binding protein
MPYAEPGGESMEHEQDASQILIVTGLSGAGKSTALHYLEDMGFYCVDNLPPALLTKFLDVSSQEDKRIQRIALGMDIRSEGFCDGLDCCLQELINRQVDCDVIYLEAGEEVLIRRYKESRRAHPLAHENSLLEAIRQEHDLLRDLRGQASVIIDTSDLKPKDIGERLRALYGGLDVSRLQVGIMSFGYKAGIPMDADLIMDVRFLPNPFYVAELKPKTGRHQAVIDYVLGFPVTTQFIAKFTELLAFLLPFYAEEGKHSLLIAVGCTGGQHRSVVLTDYIAACLRERGWQVYAQHRDLG